MTIKTFNYKFGTKTIQCAICTTAFKNALGEDVVQLVTSDADEISLCANLTFNTTTPPPKVTNGNHTLWFKNYTENVGILEQLVELGIVRIIPGALVKQGFVTCPAVELLVPREEQALKCSNPNCFQYECAARFKRCSRCRKAVYCSVECQKVDWEEGGMMPHKKVCGK